MVVLDLVWTTDSGKSSAVGNGEEAFETGENMGGAVKPSSNPGGAGKARFNVATPTNVARGCSGDLHYDRPRNLPSNPPELLCICIVRVYTESYVDSQNSLFCLLTCNNDHKSLYMPILWYVIISPNSI